MSHFSFLIFGILGLLIPVQGDLKVGFYNQTCPKVEAIILDYVKKHIPNAPSLAAPLLRMQFHDCFVRVSVLPSPIPQIPSSVLVCLNSSLIELG